MMKRLLTITACCWAATLMAETRPIMLILAPHDLADSWRWYAAQRQENHPEVAVLVKDTDEIYKQFEYKDIRCPSTGPRPSNEVGPNDCRYPSESIYRWLQNYYTQNPTLKYLVLGGAWLDVTDSAVHYLQDGSEITLGNAIPSMRVKPNIKEGGFYNPTDMYYACLKDQNETGHHWDPNNDGIYLVGNHGSGGEEDQTRGWVDVAVTRMSMKPIIMDSSVEFNPEFELVGGQRVLNQHQLITNFLYKVNRAEGKGVVGRRIVNNKDVYDLAENEANPFTGNHKLAITSSYLQNKACGPNDPKVLRDENEFFDGVPNMYAPEYPSRWEDTGPHMRRHVSEVAAFNRPVLETVSYHANNIYSQNAVGSAFSGVFNNYDREIGAVNGHGWAGGTGWFSAKTFSTCKGLTKINVVGISCETGYLDIYGNQNGKSVANLSLGESGMANVTKTGGVIASINNSRYGWVNWETEVLFGYNQSWRMHYWFYDSVVKGMNAGSAWLRMVQEYYKDFGYTHMPPAIPGQCYTQMMLFGDPLIAAVSDENPNAVMSYDVPSGTTKLEREGDLLKVMKGMTVAGDKLEIGINGGVGGVPNEYAMKTVTGHQVPDEDANAKRPNGLKFTGEKGELVFNNTKDDAYFFVNKVENAKKITFAGAGAIINTDQFVGLPDDGLVFEGKEGFVGKTARPNVIRANLDKTTGTLRRFLPLNLSNTSLQFETYDAFAGYEGESFATLTDSKLCFRVSRWRGLGDYPETLRGNLTLNSSILAADYPAVINLAAPTITVSGDSAIETTHGGTFRLNGTTNVVLANGATLTLDAEFVAPNGNAALNFSGSGRVIVKNPKGLIGNVNFASGVDLELGDLPLSNVSSLTLAAGNKLVLKRDGTFYQLLPMTGALQAEGVEVYLKSDNVEQPLDAEISPTGAIFQTGSISSWTKVEGVWEGAEKYFPDIEGGVSTVNVEKNVAVSSLFFANKATTYTFQAATGATPTLTFDSLSIGGATRFLIPSVFNARLFIASGDFVGSAVTSPVVEIGAGGSYESERTNGTTLRVQKDGTLVLSGEHALTLEFAEGAIVKATNGAALSWTDQTSVLWPESGKVIVDARDFTATSDLKPIISGVRADMAFLRHLEVRGENVSLALNEKGDVCLVAIESADENWLRDEVVEITETPKTMTIGSAKRAATLTYKTSLENAVLNLIVDGGSLLTDELHFEGFARVNLVNVKLGTGTLYAAPETHISGDSSGRLSIGGNDSVYLESPTDPWILAEGIQGMIYVGITDRAHAERQQVFTIAANEDWPIGGFSAVAYDPVSAQVNDAFTFVRESTAVYLVPPGIKGTVSTAGETKWSEIRWIAYDGQPVKITDWANVYSVEIVSANDAAVVVMDGAPKLKLVTSGSKLTLKADADAAVKLPSEIVFNNELTIEGAILPALDYVKGSGKLVLATDDVTEIVIPGSIMPISAPVEIRKGSTLRLAHQTYFQNKSADFRHLSGTGTLEIKDVSQRGARFFMPAQNLMFPTTLTFKLETELELQRVHCDTPLTVGNLCGSGKWGYGLMDPNTMLVEMGYFMANNTDRGFDKWKAANCGTRVLKTVQSDVSEWTGWMPDWYGMNGFGINFNVRLVVTGDGTVPNLARRFVFSGKAADNASLSCQGDKGANHDVTIESSGAFELNGYWNGNIVNNGLLVLGPKRVIKAKTGFSGNGKIATLGDQIDLTARSEFKNYTLAAGTYGEIFFSAAQDFNVEQEVMSAEEYDPKEELILVAEKDGVRQWQRATADNFKDGKLFWLGTGGKETEANIVLEIGSEAKEGFFGLISDDKYLGGATSVTLRGVSTESSKLDATSDLGQYKGIVNLSNVTVKSVSPIETKLGKNPVGKLIFVVDDPGHESDLMGLETGFTYDPTQFSVEIVDKEGRQVTTYWTWTAQNGALKYVLTDPESNLYMPRAFRFDGDLASWGSNGQNLGTISANNFVRSRAGSALTGHNQYGSGFEIGGNDWTVAWSARLSPTPNAVHFALGTMAGGGFALTTVDDNHVAISRWRGSQAATSLIEAKVPFATKRFNSYILTYRNGYYTLYVNGEKVGETTKDVENAPGYGNTINWQFFSIHGGNVGATDYGTAGAIDDWRLYTVALGEEMIKAIAAEFSPWPEFGKPDESGVIKIDVDEVDGQIFVEGTNTYHLTSSKAGTSVARFVSLSDTAKIIIDDGVEIVVDMSSTNRTPLRGHEVEILTGGRLVLNQLDDMCDNGKNLAGPGLMTNIVGRGTLEFRSDSQRYTLQFGSSRKAFATSPHLNPYWDENLSVCINTKVRLQSQFQTEAGPLVLRNLSGNGRFEQYGGATGEARYIEVVQTEKTVFTGSIPAGTTLTVVGEGNAPNAETPLVFSPKAALQSNNTIKISSNAALAITNSESVKNATIYNDGLLVLEPAANETVDLSALTFGFSSSVVQKIAMTGEGTVIAPIGGFMLMSNPTGTLKIPSGTNVVDGQYIMTLAPGVTIDPSVFKLVIADSQRQAIPYADGDELKFRFRVSPPKILFR